MSKQRKTKAQKQRVQAHRRQQFLGRGTPNLLEINKNHPTSAVEKATISNSKTDEKNTKSGWSLLQRRSLIISLLILGSILLLQLSLWLLFKFTSIDTTIYDTIKL